MDKETKKYFEELQKRLHGSEPVNIDDEQELLNYTYLQIFRYWPLNIDYLDKHYKTLERAFNRVKKELLKDYEVPMNSDCSSWTFEDWLIQVKFSRWYSEKERKFKELINN